MTFPVLTVHKMPPDLHMYIYHECPGLLGAVFCISRVSQHLSPCMLFDIIHKRVTGNGTSHHREKRGRHKAGRGDGGGRDFQLPTHYTSSWVKIAPPQRSSLQWCPSLRQEVVSPVITTVGFSSRICLQILRAPRMDTG